MQRPICILLAALPACSAAGAGPLEDPKLSSTGGSPSDTAPIATTDPSETASGGSSSGFIGMQPTTTTVGDETCTAVVQQAEKRVGGNADIIWAVDNSLSMTEEAAAVQNNMNTFSNRIAGAGIDAHVVLVSAPPPPTGDQCIDPTGITCLFVPGLTVDSTGICIDAPLGAQGACPANDDTNLAGGYLHVRQMVNSNDALAVLQNTFGQWQSMLRPDAAKTFVVVTDDNATGTPTATDFENWVNSQPLFQGAVWRFSGVFCSTQSANCAAVGSTYVDLVQHTGGISGNLADFASGQVDTQFATVIDSLATAVVQDAVPVDCEWLIPAPPDGETLDPDAVNVQYTNGTGTTETIYGVDELSQCTDQYGGWYYDNPSAPTRVIACPQTCTTIQADDAARIDVLFGCAREEPPIR